MTVYVLHFSHPYKHAKHYIGYTPNRNVKKRLEQHKRGMGSPLVRASYMAGATIEIAHVWPHEGQQFERNLKDRKDVRLWCKLCGIREKRLPDPTRMSTKFLERKRRFDCAGFE